MWIFSLRRLHVILFYSITTFADDKEARSEIMNFMGSRNLVFQLKPQQCDLSCVQCTVVFKTHANSMLHLLRITGCKKSDTNHVVTVIRGWCNITENGEAACTTIIINYYHGINMSDIKIERRFDDSMSSLSSSKYMIELIVYTVVVVWKYVRNWKGY